MAFVDIFGIGQYHVLVLLSAHFESVKLRIPEGAQTGKLFRLKGKGVKPIRSHAQGDMLCRVVVETPVHLSSEQKELLRQFKQSMSDDGNKQSPNKDSFFSAVRNFFDGMTK